MTYTIFILHILFLFSILTVLFWKIISKEMQNLTSGELSSGVKTNSLITLQIVFKLVNSHHIQ